MDLQSKTIFLKESEKDVFATLQEKGIETKSFSKKFQYLFKKVYNNEVGYYNFMQDGMLYKFIVLPKSIDINDSEKEKSFVNYLLHYYRINNKYAYDKIKKIPNSVLSLAFESNNNTEQVHNPVALFEFHKTKAILKNIEAFFQKHKNYKRVEQDYTSQAIKHKLNLTKNIKEMNKSKIHQSKRVDVMYSQIATVSYYVLKLYIQKRLNHADIHNAKILKQHAMKINSLIVRKYGIDKRFSLSLPKLYGHKVTKVFQKKDEYKMLLANLRSLFGYEQFYKDSQNMASIRHDLYTSSFFINPSLFYEWYVYDILKKYADANGKTIAFDKQEGTVTKYKLNEESKSSNPDYILTDQKSNVKIVIDAKWKNIEKLGDIKLDDYLKLQFDNDLLTNNDFGVVPYLIYPMISIEDRVCNIVYQDENIFTFNLLEIDMNFANRDNSLSFSYDFESKAKEIKEIEKIVVNQTKGSQLSKEIESSRNEIIVELIEAENKEEKESIGGLFDEKLLQKSEALAKELEIKILPEVQVLLDEFSKVMEEESITFLKSTSTIYAHYRNMEDIAFDFSMPGSGLWKLIEVELNTSFVRLIRYKEGVISNSSSWDAIIHADKEINIKWVKLNERDKGNVLKGLMFGQLKFLSRNDYVKSLFKDIVQYDFDNQWVILDKVVQYRNEHAHIKSMPKNIFDELWDLLFKKDNTGKNELQKLLRFKQNMKAYINE